MSGDAIGLFAIPLALIVAPFALAGLMIHGVARAGGAAASAARDSERRRAEEESKRREALRRKLSELRGAQKESEKAFQKQAERDEAFFKGLREEARAMREDFLTRAQEGGEPDGAFLDSLREGWTRLEDGARELRQSAEQEAKRDAEELMRAVRRDLEERALALLEGSPEEDYALEYAALCLAEAERCRAALWEESGEPEELQRAWEEAENGRYESAAALAAIAVASMTQAFYMRREAERRQASLREHALLLCGELREWIAGMRTLTPEIRLEMEKRSGVVLDDGLVGLEIPALDDVLARLDALEAEAKRECSDDLLRRLHNIVPRAQDIAQEALYGENDRILRENLARQVEERFAALGFTGYCREEEGALVLIEQNDFTGEEVVITLSKGVSTEDALKNQLGLHVVKGDASDEERKRAYRELAAQAMRDAHVRAEASLVCQENTRGQLSRGKEGK